MENIFSTITPFLLLIIVLPIIIYNTRKKQIKNFNISFKPFDLTNNPSVSNLNLTGISKNAIIYSEEWYTIGDPSNLFSRIKSNFKQKTLVEFIQGNSNNELEMRIGKGYSFLNYARDIPRKLYVRIDTFETMTKILTVYIVDIKYTSTTFWNNSIRMNYEEDILSIKEIIGMRTESTQNRFLQNAKLPTSKEPAIAILFELLLPGIGLSYKYGFDFRFLSISILVLGIQFFLWHGFVAPFFTETKYASTVYGKPISIPNGLIFFLIILFVITRISSVFLFRGDKRIFTLNERNRNLEQQIKQYKNEVSNYKSLTESAKYTSDSFIHEIQKYYRLKINNIFTNEEFNERLNNIFSNLKINGITEMPEDFLSNVIELKVKGILTSEEINKIKDIIITKL